MTTSDMYACVADFHAAADDCYKRAERAKAAGLIDVAASYQNAASYYSAQAVKVKREYNPCDYIEIDVVEM